MWKPKSRCYTCSLQLGYTSTQAQKEFGNTMYAYMWLPINIVCIYTYTHLNLYLFMYLSPFQKLWVHTNISSFSPTSWGHSTFFPFHIRSSLFWLGDSYLLSLLCSFHQAVVCNHSSIYATVPKGNHSQLYSHSDPARLSFHTDALLTLVRVWFPILGHSLCGHPSHCTWSLTPHAGLLPQLGCPISPGLWLPTLEHHGFNMNMEIRIKALESELSRIRTFHKDSNKSKLEKYKQPNLKC